MRSSSLARMRARTSGNRSRTRAGEFQQPGAALLQRVAQARALAVAGARQVGQRLARAGCARRRSGRGVARAVADHARPAQQIQHIDSRGHACLRGNLLRPRGQRLASNSASTSSAAAAIGGPKVQRALDLAAAHRGGDRLAEFRFGGAKFLRQPAAHLEKAVIDGLQFPGQKSPGELPLASGKAGHATNHRGRALKSAIIGGRSLSAAEERALQIETADVSLIGHREENQDRVAVAAAEQAVLLVVIDGMGGHAEGARAAETALSTVLEAFWQTPHPIFDPLGFLHLSLGRAHEEVVKLGAALSVGSAAARDVRRVPGAGFRGLLGACRR